MSFRLMFKRYPKLVDEHHRVGPMTPVSFCAIRERKRVRQQYISGRSGRPVLSKQKSQGGTSLPPAVLRQTHIELDAGTVGSDEEGAACTNTHSKRREGIFA